MAGSTTGRRVVVPLTNKSGGSVAAGDVVIIDTGNNDAFTTTTTAAFTGTVGIAQATIANNAVGPVCTSGYVALVNVNASQTRGNYGKTHTVAKQAADAGASRATGVFCQWLTGGSTPDAMLFGIVDSGVGGSLTDHTHAATGTGSNGGGATLSPTTLNIPQATPATTEGQIGVDTTTHRFLGYDTQRARGIAEVGWTPRALPIGADSSSAYSTAIALAANGGSLAVAMWVPAHMLFEQVRVRNTDTTTARTWGWDLYEQRLNNGNAGENTLDRVAASNGDESFTASGTSVRTLGVASAPVYLPPGIYYLVLQSTHATSTFGVGSTAPAALASAQAQTKTTTNPNGATLDFVAATWVQSIAAIAVVMDGRVFGMTTVL